MQRYLASAVLVIGLLGGESSAWTMKPRATVRVVSEAKSVWPLEAYSVGAWLSGHAQELRPVLESRLPGRTVLIEHAKVMGRQEVARGPWLVNPNERAMFVVKIPVVRPDEPWTVRDGQIVVDGRKRLVEEREGTWRRREERVEGKRVVQTEVHSTDTVRERRPGQLEPVPWEDAAELAATVTIWVDRFGRIYDPLE